MRQVFGFTAAFCLLGSLLCEPSHAGLPRSTPEAQGVSSPAVLDFIDAADRELDSLHSFMLLRHGHVVAEGWWTPYRAESRHLLNSLSKSFTSTAVGMAINEGQLSLDDVVVDAFPELAPQAPAAHLRAMRLRDLLRMNTGHEDQPPRPAAGEWAKAFLAAPVPFKPGTHFLYNTSATYMASAMLQRATGETLLEYLQLRLFEPLGIVDPTWESCPDGVSAGGFGLSVRTEDIACFGQLYLQQGRWGGQQLVPEDWVSAATLLQTSNGSSPDSDWDQGYGYQFWRCRHGAFRGDGAFGQFCIVLPEHDAVIAVTGGLKNMQGVLDLVWGRLLTALTSAPLPENRVAQTQLASRLQTLEIEPAAGESAAGDWLGRVYEFPANDRQLETLRLDRGSDGVTAVLRVRIDGTESAIPLGHRRWVDSRGAWLTPAVQPVAASGAWTGEDALHVRLCFYETPYVVTLTLKFTGDVVEVRTAANVGFGGIKAEVLPGRRAAQ